MVVLQIVLLTLLSLLPGLLLLLRSRQLYWQRRNVPVHATNRFYLRRVKQIAIFMEEIYIAMKRDGNSFAGFFIFFIPSLMLIDLDLIKNVLVTNADIFINRGMYHNTRDDPLSGNLLRLEGAAWKRLRAKLTPTFSSGKMKSMLPIVVSIGEHFEQVVGKLIADHLNEDVEIRNLCARYTTDVIGSVAFGLECNSLENPEVEFLRKGQKAFKDFRPFVEIFGTRFPRVFRRLGVKAFSQELIDFYSNIVKQSIEYREKNNIKRNDFLDLLLELRNDKENRDFVLTVDEIVAQAFVFFIGGFETSSSTMSFCLFELSHNQEIQNRARKEIRTCLAQYNNELSYECLKQMHYLEQIFSETLRKYPIAPSLKRVASANFQVPGTNFIIEKNTDVYIPVYAIHHDPLNYPEPDKFDPDRFEPAEIQKRHSMTYLPFGAGARSCIAERFGKMQTLIGLAMLLKNFQFSATITTPKKLQFDAVSARTLTVKGGIHLKIEKVN